MSKTIEIVELKIEEGRICLKDGQIIKARPLGKPIIFHHYEADKTLFENMSQHPEFLDISRDDLGDLELECLGVVIGDGLKRPGEKGYAPCYPVQFYIVAERKNRGW